MRCSQNERIYLKIPEPVVVERADQTYREKYKYPSRHAETEEANLSMRELLGVEDKRIRVLLNNNKAQILPRRAKHEKMASRIIGKTVDECNHENSNDYRDALIFSQFVDICEDAQHQNHEIVMVTNDNGMKARVNEYLTDKLELSKRVVMPKSHQKFCSKFLAGYTELPLEAEDVQDSDLTPPAVTEFSKDELKPITSDTNYTFEAAQTEIAERVKNAQTRVMAMAYLAFPDTSAEILKLRLGGTLGVSETDTELAIDSLLSEGCLEDVHGSYSAANEDFAIQAIEKLGDDINNLLEALE